MFTLYELYFDSRCVPKCWSKWVRQEGPWELARCAPQPSPHRLTLLAHAPCPPSVCFSLPCTILQEKLAARSINTHTGLMLLKHLHQNFSPRGLPRAGRPGTPLVSGVCSAVAGLQEQWWPSSGDETPGRQVPKCPQSARRGMAPLENSGPTSRFLTS